MKGPGDEQARGFTFEDRTLTGKLLTLALKREASLRDDLDACRAERDKYQAVVEADPLALARRLADCSSERDDLWAERDALAEVIRFARDEWTPAGARACPLCVYKAGVFQRLCQLHQYAETLREERDKWQKKAHEASAILGAAIEAGGFGSPDVLQWEAGNTDYPREMREIVKERDEAQAALGRASALLFEMPTGPGHTAGCLCDERQCRMRREVEADPTGQAALAELVRLRGIEAAARPWHTDDPLGSIYRAFEAIDALRAALDAPVLNRVEG